jgi:hypothetical protein
VKDLARLAPFFAQEAMTMRDVLKKTFFVCALLVLGANGPCQQRVDLNQSANGCTELSCTASQICVHYPSCSGGAGNYQCEDAASSQAALCGNYPSYSLSPDHLVLECVCSSQSSDAGNPQDGGTVSDLSQATCGQGVCTASQQVCVHYPACTAGGSQSAGCESNDPSGFSSLCGNYGGKYSVDSSQTNVNCLCP